MRWFAAPASVGLISCLLAPSALGQSSSHTRAGRIEGTAIVAPALATKKPRFRVYADVGTVSVPAPRRAEANEVQNVVIYLESAPSLSSAGTSADRARSRLAIEQRSEAFVPHVLAVLTGSTVEFPNEDFVFHNVFSLSKARAFDLGRYPKGASKSVRFDRAGIVQVFCHIHSDMSAVVLVVDNPFFSRPDSTGRFTIDGIPPGEYRVAAWHERARPVVRTVRILPGETARLNFNLPLPLEP
jgi:plastocyanin